LTPPEVVRAVREIGGLPPESGESRTISRAAAGEEEVFEANVVDFRGVPVLAVGRYFPDHRLGFVAKLDRSEAFQGLRRIRNFALVALVLALVALELVFLTIQRS
ncbi:MAG: hypothetical protein GWO24_32630, partial [Akkermansiaceae bacterium]|nr:hypothetical protein [Akkermansiaceae bacterium]